MNITLEQTRQAMKELVESKPEGFGYKDVAPGWSPGLSWTDPNYQACKYVIGGKPACIAGQVAYALGMSVHTLSEYEGDGAHMLEPFEEEARWYLSNAQNSQDRGLSWALAYQAAEMLLILGTRQSNKEWDR